MTIYRTPIAGAGTSEDPLRPAVEPAGVEPAHCYYAADHVLVATAGPTPEAREAVELTKTEVDATTAELPRDRRLVRGMAAAELPEAGTIKLDQPERRTP